MVGLLAGLLLLGGGAFVIASGLAFALGPPPWRMVVVAALGVTALVVFFLLAWLDSSPTEACHDCGQVLGRWMSPVFVFYLLVNGVTWLVGSLTGWSIRRTRA